MKRALALALSIVLVLALLPFAASARTLTDGEKSIFEELRSPVKTTDGRYTLPINLIVNEAENYWAGQDRVLTSEEVEAILGYIRHAEQTVKNYGTGIVENWTQEIRETVLQDIDQAARVVGLRAFGHGKSAPADLGNEHSYGSISIGIYDGTNYQPIFGEDELEPHFYSGGGSTTPDEPEYSSESDFEYVVVDGRAIIIHYTGRDSNVVIPPTLGGYPVGGIQNGAFAGNDNVRSIVVPGSVTDIQDGAFAGASNLETTYYTASEQAPSEGIIKQTGYDLQSFVIWGVCGMAVLCACVFVSKKAKLF